ncbi:hypothetical protein HDA40_008183 [Hamadaea flava]|uniref:Protein phosphatase 2C-like protein n=1 Tax=Hamadaea flava TaxID=1742688 RepID=A0ABV8LN77_9ACTN|nr:hypothetical protein [Hamadaea flava]MCP2329676.1 hypothetical protein [Hamadaea flava]
MRVELASEPISRIRDNLDWAGATPTTAVVLDGLTEGPATGCTHGTAWYVGQLGTRLLAYANSDRELAECLAEAITAVSALHEDTCDLSHPGTPCTTVTMIRRRGRLTDYLVLADSPLVLDIGGTPEVVIDEAEKAVSARIGRPPNTTPEQLKEFIAQQQKHRNVDGGYWVAQVHPEAGYHALRATVDDVRGAVLASDGAALLVTDFGLWGWDQFLQTAYADGPQAVIDETRRAEASDPDRVRWPRAKVSDDATAIVCRWS